MILLLSIFNKDCKFIKFWHDWKKMSEIFYSLLVYNSIFKLVQTQIDVNLFPGMKIKFRIEAFH